MIKFDGVNKAFAGQPAVKDLNLHLREGAFSVLIGTSGSGKSTTLKMINQLVEQDSGVIRFAGEDIRRQPLLALRRLYGVRHSVNRPVSTWTGGAKYRHRRRSSGKWPRREKLLERVDELMALLGLEPRLRDRYPHQLSGGQQQRVGVARALAANPEVPLMDEPFGALDPVTGEALQEETPRIHRLFGGARLCSSPMISMKRYAWRIIWC